MKIFNIIKQIFCEHAGKWENVHGGRIIFCLHCKAAVTFQSTKEMEVETEIIEKFLSSNTPQNDKRWY